MWLTYQSILNEIIKTHGSNDYSIPHMGKAKLEREGRLPLTLDVCEEGIQWLEELYPNLYTDVNYLEDILDSDSADEEWDDINAHVAETVAAGRDLS